MVAAVVSPSIPSGLRLVDTPVVFGPNNHDLIYATDPEVVAIGPAGSGKTFAACTKIHAIANDYPGARILMVRKTLESLKSGALNTFINGVQPQRYGVQTFGGNRFFPAEFRYRNGSVVLVSGMDKADKILSAEFDVIFVNESPELTETDWQILKTRLRNGVVPFQQLMGDGNPAGPRHWLNVRCNNGQTRRITSTHKDNPAYWDWRRNDWTEAGRQYIDVILGSLTGVQRKRLLEGVWAASEGLVYPEFVPEMIRDTYVPRQMEDVGEPGRMFDVPVWGDQVDVRGWTTYLTVDVGSRNPTAILTAHVAGDKRVHISRELYRRNMTSTEIVAAIEAEADRCDPDLIYIDPSAKGTIDDLVRDGYPVEPANNDVLDGIRRVKTTLATGFTVDRACTNLIDEFGLYAYPDNPKVETDKPVKEHDHALDAVRYLCAGIVEPAVDLLAYYRGITA